MGAIELRLSGGSHIVLRGAEEGAKVAFAAGDGEKQPTFTMTAYNGGPVRPERPALGVPLIVDLASASAPATLPVVLDHDDSQIVGQADSIRITANGIEASGRVTGDWKRPGDPAEKVVTHARNGFSWGVSPFGNIGRLEEVRAGSSVMVNGRTVSGPVYVARSVRLRHLSLLADGADQSASARIAAAAAKENPMDPKFAEWLKARGLDSATLGEATIAALKSDYEASLKAGGGGDQPPKPRLVTGDDPLAFAKAKRDRTQRMNEIAARAGDDYPEAIEVVEGLLAKAQEQNWTVGDFETAVVRETTRHLRARPIDNRPRGSNDDGLIPQEVFEAGICMSGNMSEASLKKNFSQEVLNRAHDRWRGRLGLIDALTIAARRAGWSGDSPSADLQGVLECAFDGGRRRNRDGNDRLMAGGGPSTYDISNIVSNVMNKFLVDHFNAVDRKAFDRISATRNVKDFKQITSVTLTGDITFTEVPASGKLDHGTFADQAYTNQASTYGKMVGVSRKDMINDDLGALTQLARRIGRGGALALLHRFWTVFMDNSAVFTSGRGNYDEGSDTALGHDSLSAGKTLFNKQTDPDGKTLNVPPRVLVVPPELEAMGMRLMKSELLITGADTTLPNVNIHQGTLDLVMARELSNSAYTGYSALAWYLVADPNDLPLIETCYLNGVRQPTVAQAQTQGFLGIFFEAFFDFGCAIQEYRAGQKQKGEA